MKADARKKGGGESHLSCADPPELVIQDWIILCLLLLGGRVLKERGKNRQWQGEEKKWIFVGAGRTGKGSKAEQEESRREEEKRRLIYQGPLMGRPKAVKLNSIGGNDSHFFVF
uniref:Uncharacterized protein n=1 Tax=Oryza sativa subsp. japonica TaxID=39947 RepID=Q2QYJ2_ORYSJ|nr:hypothetical protein LOC_Os12g02480 [Oryza sativa Japonica Group]